MVYSKSGNKWFILRVATNGLFLEWQQMVILRVNGKTLFILRVATNGLFLGL